MTTLFASLRQTLGSFRLLWLLYVITLVLGLLVALPFYNTLKIEDQNSLAFLNLLDGFDYTIYTDFMHRSERVINPLFSVGRWLGLLYILLSVFVAGGILLRFSQPKPRFDAGMFWQGCSQYVGRFLKVVGVTLLFTFIGGGLWLVVGTLASIAVEDTLTERGLFWVGAGFFVLFALTATLALCIGDYAKVLMFREDERRAFRAYGLAGRLVIRNLGKTYGTYWLFMLIGAALFGIYFLIDDIVMMRGWLTILFMLVVQQTLVFARVGLKVWSLGTAYAIYETLPKPVPAPRPIPLSESTDEPISVVIPEEKPLPPAE
ncbi:hypothetical protein [Spirosoma agri]|uniref:DUF975 family protein n=1 Tax=Spirosoma agri TaxID=1987381 RepID=A0A6M0ICD3_9BACT|nr:hypothetical protein [Spirosoma agri]NEU65906.1 hypothetical protein [Spirosoma agri]